MFHRNPLFKVTIFPSRDKANGDLHSRRPRPGRCNPLENWGQVAIKIHIWKSDPINPHLKIKSNQSTFDNQTNWIFTTFQSYLACYRPLAKGKISQVSLCLDPAYFCHTRSFFADFWTLGSAASPESEVASEPRCSSWRTRRGFSNSLSPLNQP